MARVLVVEDELNMRRVLSVILQEDGHSVTEAAGLAEGRARLAEGRFDVVFTDQKMPDGEGLQLLETSRDADPTLPVVLITAFASVELAVNAMRLGAFDFITKPFVPEVVRAAARRAGERAALLRENERLRGEVRRLGGAPPLLGESPAVKALRDQIGRVAPTPATVLITGETGSGKELVARAIHEGSPRRDQPFVAVNCAAFTESLLESELFGHERGAFTGADRSRQGLFETAHTGTLFLDEAGEMSLAVQARLLRVLADGKVTRVGGDAPRQVDVRVLVATHRDLEQRAREGLFRQDLYYRIAVVPLHVPPLRARREDVPLLAAHFLQQVAQDLKMPPRSIARAAMDRLVAYDFPGNVRELRNLIERALILSRGAELGAGDFPVGAGGPRGGGAADSRAGATGAESVTDAPGAAAGGAAPGRSAEALAAGLPAHLDLRGTLEALEIELVKRALLAANGVQAEAARSLGLSRSDMQYRIRKFGLDLSQD